MSLAAKSVSLSPLLSICGEKGYGSRFNLLKMM
jgi:hypothetical protein